MAKPIFNLPVPQPGQTTKQLLDAENQRVIDALYGVANPEDRERAVDAADRAETAAETVGTLEEIIPIAQEISAARDATQLVALSTGYQPDIATAEAALSDGDVFFLIDGGDAVYYQIASGSAEIINGLSVPLRAALDDEAARLDFIALNILNRAEFHSGQNDLIPDFININSEGFEIIQDTGSQAEFWTNDNDEFPDLVFVDRDGGVLLANAPDETFEDRIGALETQSASVNSRLIAAENDAEEARLLSESALAAAASGADLFASVTAGLNATTDGQFFLVAEGGGSFQALYQNSSGDPVFIDELPSLRNLPSAEYVAGEGRPYRRGESIIQSRNISSFFTDISSSFFTTHTDVYGYFDTLMSENPDYVTRFKLGEDAVGNEIFEYAFTPPALRLRHWTSDQTANPKIILIGGIHGHERSALVTNITLATELCQNWRRRDMLEDLRWQSQYVFVPCLCPTGVDSSSRKNHNGVDLNRNFPYDWENAGSTDPESISYRGPSAGSEAETQVAMSIAMRHLDANGIIDHHNSSSLTVQGFGPWIGTIGQSNLGVAMQALQHVDAWSRREIADISEGLSEFARLTDSVSGGMVGWFNVEGGRPAWLMETPQTTGLGSLSNQRRLAFEMARALSHKIWLKEQMKRLQSMENIG